MLLLSLILLFYLTLRFFFFFYQIVPYFGVMFSTFEFCKRVCLYRNGYIESPLNYKLTPGVDQSLQPQELRELKLLRRENFEPRKSALENWHQGVHCRYTQYLSQGPLQERHTELTGTSVSADCMVLVLRHQCQEWINLVSHLLNGYKQYE